MENPFTHGQPGAADYESDLPDLSDISIPDLLDQDESVLGHALRRIVAEIDRNQDAFVGFNSSI